MLTVIALSLFFIFGCSVDFAYRLGLSKQGDRQQETRTSIEMDLMAISISLGCILGAFAIRLTNVTDDFWRVIIITIGAAIGFFAIGMIDDKAIVRFFGVELHDRQ
jgi:UDP-N-acetylmuramyl pentapeptide phosphotransferase/UDP-N-acetylglucosamine-1-phosphate transferase